jgi:hypothetical protein
MEIRWDPASPALHSAASALLEITEGNSRMTVRLDPARLRRGCFTYVRHSSRVDLRLLAAYRKSGNAEERAVFAGRLPEPEPSPGELQARQERDRLARQTAELQLALELQRHRSRRLERIVQSLRSELESERAEPARSQAAPSLLPPGLEP